jgi:hypothetical protein
MWAKLISIADERLGGANWGRFCAIAQGLLLSWAVAVQLGLLAGPAPAPVLGREIAGGDAAAHAIASRSLELLVLASLVQVGAFAILVPAVLSRVSSSLLRRLIWYSGAPWSWLLLGLSLFAAVVAANFFTESYAPLAATLVSISGLFAAGNAVYALVTATYPAHLLAAARTSFVSDIRWLRRPFLPHWTIAAREHGGRGTPARERISAVWEKLGHYKTSRAHGVAAEGVRALHHAAVHALKAGEFDTANTASGYAIGVLGEYLVPTRLAPSWFDDSLIEAALDGTFELARSAAELPVQVARRDALEQVTALGLALLEVQSEALEVREAESKVSQAPTWNYHLDRWFGRLRRLAVELVTSPHSGDVAFGLVKCATEVTGSSIGRPASYTALREFPGWAIEFIGLSDSRGRLPSAFAIYILLGDLAKTWHALLGRPWREWAVVDHRALGKVVAEGLSRLLREPQDGLDVRPLSVVEDVLGMHSGLWGVVFQLDEQSEASDARATRSASLFADFVNLAEFCMDERRRLNYGYEMTVTSGVLAGTIALAPTVWREDWKRVDQSTSSWRYFPQPSAVESEAEAALWAYAIEVLQLVRDGVIWDQDVLPGLLVSSGVFLAGDLRDRSGARRQGAPAALWELSLEIALARSTSPIEREPWLAGVWSALTYFAIWTGQSAQRSQSAKQLLQCVEAWRLAHEFEWDHLLDPTGLLDEAKRALSVHMARVSTEEWQADQVERLRARLFSDEVRRVGRSLVESLGGESRQRNGES